MPKINRFLICGSPRYNNYYILKNFLDNYVTPGSLILTCGNDKGTDVLVRKYAEYHNCVLEEYPLKKKTQDEQSSRNAQLIRNSNYQIFFDDRVSNSTVTKLIQYCKASWMNPIINLVDLITDNINLDVKLIDESNPMCAICDGLGPIEDNPEEHIADFIEEFLKNDKYKEAINRLNTSNFVGRVGSRYDGIVYWLVRNKAICCNDIYLKSDSATKTVKYDQCALDELQRKWDKKPHSGQIYTTTGLSIAKGFKRTVNNGKHIYLEINEFDVIKENIWLPIGEEEKKEFDPKEIHYKTKDTSRTDIFRKEVSLSVHDNFIVGYWYVNVDTLKCDN